MCNRNTQLKEQIEAKRDPGSNFGPEKNTSCVNFVLFNPTVQPQLVLEFNRNCIFAPRNAVVMLLPKFVLVLLLHCNSFTTVSFLFCDIKLHVICLFASLVMRHFRHMASVPHVWCNECH